MVFNHSAVAIQCSNLFGSNHARDGGEVVGYANVGPGRAIEQRLDGGAGVVTEFEDQDAARLEMGGGLRDEVGVEFVAFFSAEESDCGFVVAYLVRKSCRFASRDVRRIADD